jgi:hypothetical protein
MLATAFHHRSQERLSILVAAAAGPTARAALAVVVMAA